MESEGSLNQGRPVGVDAGVHAETDFGIEHRQGPERYRFYEPTVNQHLAVLLHGCKVEREGAAGSDRFGNRPLAYDGQCTRCQVGAADRQRPLEIIEGRPIEKLPVEPVRQPPPIDQGGFVEAKIEALRPDLHGVLLADDVLDADPGATECIESRDNGPVAGSREHVWCHTVGVKNLQNAYVRQPSGGASSKRQAKPGALVHPLCHATMLHRLAPKGRH